jgi:hypothetical protein
MFSFRTLPLNAHSDNNDDKRDAQTTRNDTSHFTRDRRRRARAMRRSSRRRSTPRCVLLSSPCSMPTPPYAFESSVDATNVCLLDQCNGSIVGVARRALVRVGLAISQWRMCPFCFVLFFFRAVVVNSDVLTLSSVRSDCVCAVCAVGVAAAERVVIDRAQRFE